MTTASRRIAYSKGHEAEALACDYLLKQGYIILEQRYKCAYGEIDIIAQSGNVLAFIEVKARGNYGKAVESVTARQQQRISNSAALFLSTFDDAVSDCRFDVITVCDGIIHHLPHAWITE